MDRCVVCGRSPPVEKLDPVGHRRGQDGSSEPQKATHHFSRGEALLLGNDDTRVVLPRMEILAMKPAEVGSVVSDQYAANSGCRLQLLLVAGFAQVEFRGGGHIDTALPKRTHQSMRFDVLVEVERECVHAAAAVDGAGNAARSSASEASISDWFKW